ncbi:MAG: sigma-70 family RNA polymerase sigma factor [Clostridia bacterium]|nr:sigma-70 family RNA polymerase sigma factor [Clostridia bacterium]
MEDLMIIDLFFARNEQAINETDAKYGKLCLSIANNILNSDEDAEECVNDTYLSIWKKIPPTRPNDFKSFICKIVRNLSIKKLEYNLALKRSKNMTVSYSELENVLYDSDICDETEYKNIGKIISDFLRQEKEEVRNVFIRKYFFFDSTGDIARRYSFTESKVKSMLYHSRNRLKQYLKKEGIDI